MFDIYLDMDYKLFLKLSQKELTDLPFKDEILKLLDNKKYQESFDIVKKQSMEDGDLKYEKYYAYNSILGRYLLNNGHNDFLEHMDIAPDYCLAFSDIKEFDVPKNLTSISMGMFCECVS